jgi:aryl-alcohol dehydrogenase-like predicted oxidoreductase
MSPTSPALAWRDEESIRVIHRAVEIGITLFDTADVYGPFSNESLLGRGLRGRRDKAVIATKCGLVAEPNGKLGRNGTPEHVRAACESSLRRLRTDVIDLYQLHRVDPAVPLAETWGTMAELVDEGKVRGLGISHASIEELEQVHAQFPITAVQYELSIWAPFARKDVLPWCARTGTPFLAFSPLGRGFLTGRVTAETIGEGDPRSRDPRFTQDAMVTNQEIVAGLRSIADRLDATPAQVSIAWVLAQSDLVVPIPATKQLRWLEQNAAAVELKLDDEVLLELEMLPEAVGRMRWDYARSGR